MKPTTTLAEIESRLATTTYSGGTSPTEFPDVMSVILAVCNTTGNFILCKTASARRWRVGCAAKQLTRARLGPLSEDFTFYVGHTRFESLLIEAFTAAKKAAAKVPAYMGVRTKSPGKKALTAPTGKQGAHHRRAVTIDGREYDSIVSASISLGLDKNLIAEFGVRV